MWVEADAYIRQSALCGLTNLTLRVRTLYARAEGRVYFCVQPRPLPTPSSAPNPLVESECQSPSNPEATPRVSSVETPCVLVCVPH